MSAEADPVEGPRFRSSITLRVRWSECDPQGIAFNGSYLAWIEAAQAKYYRNLGIDLYGLARSNTFDTASVKLVMEFKTPASLDDVIVVRTRIAHVGKSSIEMTYQVVREVDDELLAEIEAIYVNYDRDAQASRPIPEYIRAAIAAHESVDP